MLIRVCTQFCVVSCFDINPSVVLQYSSYHHAIGEVASSNDDVTIFCIVRNQ